MIKFNLNKNINLLVAEVSDLHVFRAARNDTITRSAAILLLEFESCALFKSKFKQFSIFFKGFLHICIEFKGANQVSFDSCVKTMVVTAILAVMHKGELLYFWIWRDHLVCPAHIVVTV